LGEVSAASVAALIVPAWAYSLQADELSPELFRIGLALLPFLMGMLIGIATPDVEADTQVGKLTLPVIVGQQNVAWLYLAVIGVGYVLAALFFSVEMTAGVLLSLPLVWLAWRDLRHPVKTSTLGWTLLVLRPGLVTLVVMIAGLAGIWL
jgi:1,4-dihydroxy-2-naphthoate octaprenyltransferase